jgi:hypothetical protein
MPRSNPLCRAAPHHAVLLVRNHCSGLPQRCKEKKSASPTFSARFRRHAPNSNLLKQENTGPGKVGNPVLCLRRRIPDVAKWTTLCSAQGRRAQRRKTEKREPCGRPGHQIANALESGRLGHCYGGVTPWKVVSCVRRNRWLSWRPIRRRSSPSFQILAIRIFDIVIVLACGVH